MEWILPGGPSRHILGIVSITFAVFLLSLSDALVKAAGDRFALGQIVILRSLVAAGLIAGGIVLISGAGKLRPLKPAWVWARSFCLTAMWLCYYVALPSISFALAAACYYTSPVWMALLSRFVLREPVGARGWVAILVSLLGVGLVVNPALGAVSPVLLLPLAAAAFYALAGTITWSRCQNEAAAAMALNLNLCLCLAGGVGIAGLAVFAPAGTESFALSVWPVLRAKDWFLAALLGVFLAVIATAVALAYRLAPTPVVGVFDTAYLVFAALWSVVLFGEIPATREVLGIGAIGTGAVLMSSRGHRQTSR